MGSFAPQNEMHVYDLPWILAPNGIFSKGEYLTKGLVNNI
jgi:hypothetical protein